MPRLTVPAAISNEERGSARSFSDRFGVAYRPRQVLATPLPGGGQLAKVISLAAARERRGLPRFGVNSPVRHEEPSPGAWAAAGAAWWTREHWVHQIVPLVASDHLNVLKRHKVAPETLVQWAEKESLFALDQHSGRRVMVRPSTIAELMTCAMRTVQRCRAAARELGLLVDVVAGRMLTLDESTTARKAGSPQRGLSNVSALVIPETYTTRVTRPQPVHRVTPTRGSGFLQDSSIKQSSSPFNYRPAAKVKRAAQAPPAPTRQVTPAVRLAIELTRKAVWLHTTSPWRISGQLKPYAEQQFPWSAGDLCEEMDQIQRRLGYSTPHRAETSPWALLAWYLRQINPVTGSYRQRRTRARRRPWCGLCHSPAHRWIDQGTSTTPCPRCSPQAASQPLQSASPEVEPTVASDEPPCA